MSKVSVATISDNNSIDESELINQKGENDIPITRDPQSKPTSHVIRFLTLRSNSYWSICHKSFGVDLLASQHSFLDLARAVYRFDNQNMAFCDERYFVGDYYGKVTLDGVDSYLKATNPIPLSSLNLQQGQKGSYNGEFGDFTFIVHNPDIQSVDAKSAFPRKVDITIQRNLTNRCDSSHLTADEIQKAQKLRYDYEDYIDFVQSYHRLLNTCYHEVRHCAPLWTVNEEILISLFIGAGWKPKKTWESCLKYTFLNRTESAFSQRWQKCKREKFWKDHYQQYLDGHDRVDITEVKEYCINFMEREFFNGGPSFEDDSDNAAFQEFKDSRYVQA